MKPIQEVLVDMLTESRCARIEAVLAERTRRMALLIEDIYDPHNISAVLRSAESFGVQDIFAVDPRTTFSINRGITMGCDRWLSISRHQTLEDVLPQIKAAGYGLWVSSLTAESVDLADVPVDRSLVLAFGNEREGISETLLAAAAGVFKIPMIGFSQSFNISVAAAITLAQMRAKLGPSAADLSDAEKDALRLDWLCKTSKGARRYLTERYGWSEAAIDAHLDMATSRALQESLPANYDAAQGKGLL